MSPIADRLGFAVVYPDGIDKHWRYGLSEIDNVAFVDAIINRLSAQGQVDPTRVYATGLSDGGFFSVFLGCQTKTRMAAIAPVAASMTGCSCTRWMAVAIPGLVGFSTPRFGPLGPPTAITTRAKPSSSSSPRFAGS